MKKVAVILTVFNRKAITMEGLRSLYESITFVGDEYHFDIYVTDDGSTDGTADAINSTFPDIIIVKGNGKLFWSGGMRLAWQKAIDALVNYDYYLWFNDDSILFPNALQILFDSNNECGNETIISGGFRDPTSGNTSYGGWSRDFNLVKVNSLFYEPLYYMNGNLVLIPDKVFKKLGNIDKHFKHSLGDWDYSARAIKQGIHVLLTKQFVGTASRHDVPIIRPFDPSISFKERIQAFYSPRYSLSARWHFNISHLGIGKAIISYISCYFFLFFPFLSKYHARKVIE